MTDFEELIVKLRRLPRFWHPIANAVGSMRVVALADVERIADELEELVATQASTPTPEAHLCGCGDDSNGHDGKCSTCRMEQFTKPVSDTGETPT